MPEETNNLKKFKIAVIVLSIVTAALLSAVAVMLLFLLQKPEAKPTMLVEDATTPTQAQSEDADAEGYYRMNGKKIYFKDPVYGDIYLPVYADVPACTYAQENVIRRNGMTYYLEDGGINSFFGIDVSAHQKDIDWETVKLAGVDFAMIRLGYRGYGSGELIPDENFDKNVQGALDAGIDVGVYFFSQAITEAEAVEEAKMTIAMLGDYDITYPVVYDWEVITGDKARTDKMPVEMLTKCTVAFCDTIAEAGFRPMVYQNKRTTLFKLALPDVAKYDFWLAEYGDEATFYYNYDMWQYTDSGRIPGIAGDVDLNICFTDYANKEN